MTPFNDLPHLLVIRPRFNNLQVGVAMGTALHINVGLSMMAEMVLGLFIGSGKKEAGRMSVEYESVEGKS